jgi:manganese oxidase
MSSTRPETNPNPGGKTFDRLLLLVGVIATITAVMAGVAAVRAGGDPAPGETPGPGTTVPSDPEVQVITFTLNEFTIVGPAEIEPGPTIFQVVNEGAVPHNLALEGGPITPDLANGESHMLDVGDLEPGTYTITCEVPGHVGAGMTATLVVRGGADPGDGHGGHGGSGALTWQEVEENMRQSIAAFPAATEGTGGELMEPTILADGTKEFRFVVEEIRWEVEPGKVVDAYAYNRQIPGPTVKVDVGDRVKIVVENRLDMITSWHPHGLRQHPNEADGVGFITQRTPIRPGETWEVEFVAVEQSVAMYHGHDMGLHQVPNGLAGAFIVGEVPIPEGWDVVSEEIMVLNDAGNIGFSLNGKSFPATKPYVLRQGQSMLVHYMNEGLMNHPMHLHNNRQLVIAKDGFPLESPYFVDTLDVAPGERYTVLVLAELPGVWVWHCHIFSHVEKSDGSMFGMLTALIVEE